MFLCLLIVNMLDFSHNILLMHTPHHCFDVYRRVDGTVAPPCLNRDKDYQQSLVGAEVFRTCISLELLNPTNARLVWDFILVWVVYC